jgi:hypothetical protein
LADSTLYKLEIIFGKQLREFCRKHAIVYPHEFTLSKLQQFRASWNDGALARKKKQERLIGFFAFCIAHKWMNENPAKQLSRVIVKDKPTLPFASQGNAHSAGDSFQNVHGQGRIEWQLTGGLTRSSDCDASVAALGWPANR